MKRYIVYYLFFQTSTALPSMTPGEHWKSKVTKMTASDTTSYIIAKKDYDFYRYATQQPNSPFLKCWIDSSRIK